MRTTILLTLLLATLQTSTLAGQSFRRIQSPDELTEDGEYIIGAQAEFGRPFYLLTPQLTAKPLAGGMPETLTADCGAAIWSIVHRGDQIALTTRNRWLTRRNTGSEIILSDTSYDTWNFTMKDGHIVATDNNHCLRISSLTTSARFGYYSEKGYEDSLTIYKHTIPVTEMKRYQRLLDEEWETICLPFTATPSGSVRILSLIDITNEKPQYTSHTGPLRAGQAYLLHGGEGALATFIAADDEVSTTPQLSSLLQGTYTPLHLSAGRFLEQGNFRPTLDNCYVPPFRAYIPIE